MKILFTCGGTAGHINPALGVAACVKDLLPDCEILFVGAQGMMETQLVPREGYPIKTIEISNLSRSLSLKGLKHNLHTAKTLLTGGHAAKKILREFRPDIAVGTGGYVCYPVLRAAHALGIPTLVHESSAVPGLTTRLLAKRVDCVMLGFADAAENYPKGTNTVFTGTPVRGGFVRHDKRAAKRALGLPEDQPLLLSVWGSLGSDFMNAQMPEFMRLVCEKREFTMIHSAGRRGYAKLRDAVASVCGDAAEKGVHVEEYIHNMDTVMAAADLVMCRSGASTLSELAALGKPAILIPSPNVTNNHQEKNARALDSRGAASVLLEGSFTPQTLYAHVAQLLCNQNALDAMGEAMHKTGVADATLRIAQLLLHYAK